ncbi:hypothetical protein [Streptomyces sp. NPDC048639]|uniref:hypothetical protein n=1 Tax=Streptomyces sp. NPDC048639 TaxID=3365581 RepID=UPI00372432C8
MAELPEPRVFSPVTKDGYVLEFEDTFDGDALEESRWLPYYLPHWSSRASTAARYRIGDGTLRLLIEQDQQPWSPEFDGGIRVSSLQTGLFSGPVGSNVGQLRFKPGLTVREAQEDVRLYTPHHGFYEFPDDPSAPAPARPYPKEFAVDYVRGYRPARHDT